MPLCWCAIRLRFRASCNLLGVCSRSILLLADLHGGHSRHRDWLQFDGVARLPPRPPVLRFLLHISCIRDTTRLDSFATGLQNSTWDGTVLHRVALTKYTRPNYVVDERLSGMPSCKRRDISYDTEEILSADDTFGHSFNVPNKDVGNSEGQNIQTVRQYVRHNVTKELAYR